MAWRPGPPPSPGLPISDYDQRDPWTQRFISKTDKGELSLDVDAMNGLETAAGEVFVELIRQQAERPPSPIETPWSSWKPGQTSTGYNQHHPSAKRVDSPMAQYKPFRCTYVSDPACVPQLRFANIPDSGADHDKRETSHHWRRAGRTWSRVPRFRKGDTAFKHDPEYKPRHAVGDKWYRTEAGPKLSLAGRVQESRWQSCHSMQSGREPREPTRSRLPREPKRPSPGPASYSLQDPWEVKQVCGTVPKSSMFCEPVRRLRPRTTVVFPSTASSNSCCEMSVDASVATGTDDDEDYDNHFNVQRRSCHARSATASPAYPADTGRPLFPPYPYPQNGPQNDPPPTHRACGDLRRTVGVGAPPRGRRRPPTVGPSSFARAERPNITDERRRQEESYHSKAVRLLTGSGDVLVTVNHRRTSAWGGQDRDSKPRLDRARTAGEHVPRGNAPRANVRSEATAHGGKYGYNSRNPNISEGRIGRGFKRGRQRKDESRGGRDASLLSSSRVAVGTRSSDVLTLQKNGLANGTLEAQAIKLLPADLASALPAYREPGRAQLPLIFRASSAPIVKSTPTAARAVSFARGGGGGGARRVSRRRLSGALKGGVAVDPACSVDDDFREAREADGRSSASSANIKNAGAEVEDVERNPSVAGSGGGGGGGGGGGYQTSVMAKIPPHLGRSSGPDSTGGTPRTERLHQENSTVVSYDNVSMAMLSGDETDSPRLR